MASAMRSQPNTLWLGPILLKGALADWNFLWTYSCFCEMGGMAYKGNNSNPVALE